MNYDLTSKSAVKVQLSKVVQIRKGVIDPQNYPNEIFELYSIPSYHENKIPQLVKGYDIKSSKVLICLNDCLFGKLNPRVQKVWLVNDAKTEYRKIATTEFLPIFSKTSLEGSPWLIPEFIWATLMSPNLYESIKLKVKGSTGSRQRIRPEQLLEEYISVPSLATQQQLSKRIIKAYSLSEEISRCLTENFFRVNSLLPSFLHQTYQNYEKNWETEELSKIVDHFGGGTPSKSNKKYWSGDIPWISPKDMKVFEITGSPDHITKEALERSAAILIPTNSVIVVFRSGILAHSFPVAINRVEVTTNQDLKSLVPKGDIMPEFLAYFLKSQEKSIINQCSKFGATVHSIDSDRFFSYRVPIVKIKEQQSIVTKINKFKKLQELLIQSHLDIQEKAKSLIPSFLGNLIQ